MTEPQDVLAEGIEECYQRGLDGPEASPFLTDFLAARGYALVRTPETLDVERLASVMEAMVHGTRHMTLAVGSTWQTVAARIAAEYLAVTPSPTPPEGLRAKRIDWSNVVVDEGDEAP